MRVFRTILGMVLLTVGLPTLLGGGGLWAIMQHRDPGGSFSGELQRLTVPGYAVVVPDIGELLRNDVPFARIGDTQLRLSAATTEGRAFLGIAPSDQVARYLAGVSHTRIEAVDIGTGLLPVTSSRVGGQLAPTGTPAEQPFWTASGPGQISLDPGELAGRPYSLVLMNPGGGPVLRAAVVAEVRPGWLDTSAWGLLTLGTLLLMAGVIVLVWPGRRREIVYIVEPSQVPELMHAIGAPLPLPGGVAWYSGSRPGGAHRPRTLADARPRPPALPQFAWPPNAPVGHTPELTVNEPVTLATATLDPTPGGTATGEDQHGTGYPRRRTATGTLTVPAVPLAAPAAGPRPGHPPSGAPAPADGASGAPAGSRTPDPGRPLSMLGEPSALAGLRTGQPPARRSDRRPNTPADLPPFQATAVGAWVAATAPERARQTEARAAARLAEAARRNAGKFAPAQSGSRTNPANARIPIAAPRRDNGERPDRAPEPANAPPGIPGTGSRTPAEDRITTAAQVAGTANSDTSARPAGEETTGRPGEPPATLIALHTGPAATDWTATTISRLGPAGPVTAEAAPAAPQASGSTSAGSVTTAPERNLPAAEPAGESSADRGATTSEPPSPESVARGTEAHPVGAAVAVAGPPAAGSVAARRPEAEVAAGDAVVVAGPPAAGPVEATVPADEGEAGAAAVASGKKTGRSAGDGSGRPRRAPGARTGDDLLARAQSRAGGKAVASRPAPAARRAPAAWIKAAESVAARAGQPGGVAGARAGRGDGPAAVGVPQESSTGNRPQPESAAAGRPLSYREEAAELLAAAAGGERRRRRTVAGQSRPKPGPHNGAKPDSGAGTPEGRKPGAVRPDGEATDQWA